MLFISINSLEIIIIKLKYLLKDFKHFKFNSTKVNNLTSDLNNKINNLLYI